MDEWFNGKIIATFVLKPVCYSQWGFEEGRKGSVIALCCTNYGCYHNKCIVSPVEDKLHTDRENFQNPNRL